MLLPSGDVSQNTIQRTMFEVATLLPLYWVQPDNNILSKFCYAWRATNLRSEYYHAKTNLEHVRVGLLLYDKNEKPTKAQSMSISWDSASSYTLEL